MPPTIYLGYLGGYGLERGFTKELDHVEGADDRAAPGEERLAELGLA